MTTETIEPFLRGEKLFGDTFTGGELEKWYEAEAEGYADLGAGEDSDYHYGYAELNRLHGFSRIAGQSFNHALGLGSAYGHEFNELTGRVARITIIEPSDKLISEEIAGIRPHYVKPNVAGDIPFADGTFDLTTSFGTLHHIANVTHVVKELGRVTAPGGTLILREPCVSLGDWRTPRRGLTRNERGIPRKLLLEMLDSAGWDVSYQSLCIFPLVPRLARLTGGPAYNNALLTRLDQLLSHAFAWNLRYHPRRSYHKLRPQSIFVVATKRLESLPMALKNVR